MVGLCADLREWCVVTYDLKVKGGVLLTIKMKNPKGCKVKS
jgi:hypothetical protein